MSHTPLGYSDSLRIGSVDFVSADEIKVFLDIDAPESLSLNSGTPRPFPRINGYVLIPSDNGFLVGQVEWITIERSQYPKRKGMQDFGLVDLPYPLRKLSLNPIGTLASIELEDEQKRKQQGFSFQRGVETFPSVGDPVLIPTNDQLLSIIQSGKNRSVKIGTSPLADGAEVKIDPDRLFGRHLAVLGNTGSGKSCSVAGLIRWSLNEVKTQQPNARFIVLDPNGEYRRAFKDFKNARRFSVEASLDDQDAAVSQLHVPNWFWNSAEWCGFTQASGRAQRPALQQALRQRRNSAPVGSESPSELLLANYLLGAKSTLAAQVSSNAPFMSSKDGPYWGFIEILNATLSSLSKHKSASPTLVESITPITDALQDLIDNKCKNERGYNKPFELGDFDSLYNVIDSTLDALGAKKTKELALHEDAPIPFDSNDLRTDLDFIATNSGNRQWFDSLLSRIESLLRDSRMRSVTESKHPISLDVWLREYIGGNNGENGTVTIIDLSLVPTELVHIITAVVARMTFEALQRYRRSNKHHKILPTVLVMEEAHNFVRRYSEESDNHDAATTCCRLFERIAREGRKFGLGLVLSSQRPSELSPTVFSQCNTFLLHRISNDKDQELVNKLVPDNLRGLLRDLPSLPSQNAILLGWATELPVLVRMNDLPKEHRPQSDDPDFWDVWTGAKPREVDWKKIADSWQNRSDAEEPSSNNGDETDQDPT
jgi:uncharacterized protein